MATISSGQQANLSFMAFQTSLKAGEKSTISNLAASAVQNFQKDAFLAGQRQLPLSSRMGALTYFDGKGRTIQPIPVQTNQLTVVRHPDGGGSFMRPMDLDDFQSKRIYGVEKEKVKIDAGFIVDSGAGTPAEDDGQTAINLRQAAQIKSRMGIEASDQNLESLAYDLAVFGLDFTAMAEDNPEALIETVRERSLGMLEKLVTDGGTVADRNRITGASARLVNGIQSASGSFLVVDSTTQVDVDGKTINGDAAYGVGSVVIDPIVLDLEGDGIDLSAAEEGVEFDMDGDGTKTKMGFVRDDDALLFMDENGDGVATDGRELFGNTDGHANGFEKLASYDDNGDGVINKDDAVWDSLKVWVEKTADGISAEDETMSLDEAGITSINVSYDNVRVDDGKGNLIGQTGEFERTDGSKGQAADVWLQQLGAGYSRPE